MDKLEHIGARIRLFRKHQNLTLEELAYMVHKSPSTICKYENGNVNIDILTLSEIADALKIDTSQLIDFKSGRTEPEDRNMTNFFRRHKRFYAYILLPHHNDFLIGVMDVTSSPSGSNDDTVVLYLDEGQKVDISDPMFIYTGTMTCDDNFAYINLTNISGTNDHMSILARSPQWMHNKVKSLALTVAAAFGCPSAIVMIMSTEELEINDALRDELRINSKSILDFAGSTNIIAPL